MNNALMILVAGWALTQGLAATPEFPIKPSANGRYLVDVAGIPFFYHVASTRPTGGLFTRFLLLWSAKCGSTGEWMSSE